MLVRPVLALSRYSPPGIFFSLLGTFFLSGCGNNVSNSLTYPVRSDPLVLTDKLGPERSQRDRPGQLPLLSVQGLLSFPNPYYQSAEDHKKEDLLKAGKLRDPGRLAASDRAELQNALDELFGNPSQPKVAGLDEDVKARLGLAPEILRTGSVLYRTHCLHCHGGTGNGRGTAAAWLNPHPRDYRQGLFKFQSVDQAVDGQIRKPGRHDLLRTLQQGLEGTAMPSFGLLHRPDLERLVSYVIHLSIRGEAEFETIKNAYTFNAQANALVPGTEPTPVDFLRLMTKKLGQDWLDAQTRPIVPAPFPFREGDVAALKSSLERGQALFLAEEERLKVFFPRARTDQQVLDKLKGASCVACHKDYGRQTSFKFDAWGTLIRPTNLTQGIYRGGRKPADIYFRIHSGINGSGMANFGSLLSPDQIWDLVNFVQLLPYPELLRKDFSIEVN